MWKPIVFLLLQSYLTLTGANCVCTTVPCPIEGNNHVIMGNGGADMNYMYKLHNNYEVVIMVQVQLAVLNIILAI
jgi:hypothetical protein